MITLALSILVIPVATFAAETVDVPVQFVVPDRELTTTEKSFLATVPVEAGGHLREAVEQMLKAGVCHVPVSGKYNASDPACNSVHYWTLYQAWTGPRKITLTLPEPPLPTIPPPPPLPPVVNVCPEVKVNIPSPVPCPPSVVNNYISCPTPEPPAPRQPHAGAQIVHTRSAGADIAIGWGFGGRTVQAKRFCKPNFPDPPIFDPPVRPAPPW